MGIKHIEVIYNNIDKPNKNERFYSREVIDNALREYCEKPLYLLNELPSYKDDPLQLIDLEKIIGVGIKSEWLDESTIKHTFKITKDDVKLDNLYPCMFGQGILNSEGVVENFELHGFALSDTCAFDTEVKILEK